MWAECAVLVVCVIELNKVLSKLKVCFPRYLVLFTRLVTRSCSMCFVQAGTCVMPLSRNFILRSIRNKVPPLLASASAFFIPPSLGYYDAQVPRPPPHTSPALSLMHSL